MSDQPESSSELVLCVSCGYPLRGLPSNSLCPECGTAIHRSLEGNRLERGDSTWLKQVVRGTTLLYWGAASLAVLPMIALLLASVRPAIFGTGVAMPIVEHLFPLLFGVVVLLALLGAFLLAAPEPRLAMTDAGDERGRRTVRRMSGASLALLTTLMFLSSPFSPATTVQSPDIIQKIGLFTLQLFCLWTLAWSGTRYLSDLLRRVPHHTAPDALNRAGKRLIASYLIMVFIRLLISKDSLIGRWLIDSGMTPSFSLIDGLVFLLLLVCYLRWLGLIGLARRTFKNCLRHSRRFNEHSGAVLVTANSG